MAFSGETRRKLLPAYEALTKTGAWPRAWTQPRSSLKIAPPVKTIPPLLGLEQFQTDRLGLGSQTEFGSFERVFLRHGLLGPVEAIQDQLTEERVADLSSA